VAVYRRPNRARFLLLLLVLTAITLVTIDTRGGGHGWVGTVRAKVHDLFAPIQDGTHAVLRPVGDFFTGAVHYGDLKHENAQLRDELAKARGQQLQAADAQRQLQFLLQQEHLTYVGNIPTVAAQVVETSSSNFELSVQINRGTTSGVAVDMPVVTGAGLVGRVGEVSATRATVLLITDPTFSVGVRLPTGDAALASGTGRGNPLRVDLVQPDLKVGLGSVLTTSGLQLARFPKDIPVGKVASLKQVPGALQEDMTITPVVDLNRLEFVQVLQWSPQ